MEKRPPAVEKVQHTLWIDRATGKLKIETKPAQCPHCTADARYLERISTGFFCKCCSRVVDV